MSEFLKVMKQRRSYYEIERKSLISDEQIGELIREAVKHAPSPYNMQSGRVVLLLGNHHDELWSIVMEALRAKVPVDKFAPTEAKINAFAAGYGSVLYFDDSSVTNHFANKFAGYKETFPVWAQHSLAMIQFSIWNILEEVGFGASLQHYNPLIDEAVRAKWHIPSDWKLVAQMPFGTPTNEPGEKEFMKIEERVHIFK